MSWKGSVIFSFQWFGLNRWAHGARGFKNSVFDAIEKQWDPINRRLFEKTQSDVHVITGNLKRSGVIVDPVTTPDTLTMGSEYQIDYAVYEYLRGGDHDFYAPAILEFEDQFGLALADAVAEAVNSWS